MIDFQTIIKYYILPWTGLYCCSSVSPLVSLSNKFSKTKLLKREFQEIYTHIFTCLQHNIVE